MHAHTHTKLTCTDYHNFPGLGVLTEINRLYHLWPLDITVLKELHKNDVILDRAWRYIISYNNNILTYSIISALCCRNSMSNKLYLCTIATSLYNTLWRDNRTTFLRLCQQSIENVYVWIKYTSCTNGLFYENGF